ncbi:hypothetical protein H6F43_03180 [Leptolyngbya sp. FACHB-36]|uniref:hypothetical protein n=1 Tax=Leptolyngbya sp. FACHB-36 TaxID=2692808 RepID=UPI0016806287|nr:hypothetical protein [Leptolyngbya sp. FACHB-36]MBD2019186.1 hypothetical protein [Leptolyngbya sp. FACHB-36]
MLQISIYDAQARQWRDLPIDADGHSSEFSDYLDAMLAELPQVDLPDAAEGDTDCECPSCTPSAAAPFSFLYPASFMNGGDAA